MIGTAASALWLVRGNAAVQHRLALLAAVAWAVQVASGVLFGITTYYFERHLPDIHGVAVDALLVKICCAVAGLVLTVAYLRLNSGWTLTRQLLVWRALLTLGVIALGSAAFLRWFS
ncbi:MAG TPA: hypothetical protein VIM35_06720 [Gallionella sp.]